MKKTLSLLLCLCLAAGALLCFSSCKTSKDPDPIDLTDYRLVYEADFKDALVTWAKGVGTTLSDYTGLKIATGTDAKGSATEKEILLGQTNRPESEALLAKIEGEGYAYGVVEGKLVMVGTTKLMTTMAAEAFLSACLTGTGGPALKVKETVVSNAPTVELSGAYSIVYSNDLDDEADFGSGSVSSDSFASDEEDFSNRDHGVVMASKVQQALKSVINATSTGLKMSTDKKEATKREVLVGILDRDANKQFLKSIDVDGYGVALYDQTVVVSGYNDNGLREAVAMFEQLVTLGVTTKDGQKVVVWPAGLRVTTSKSFGWKLDVPRPEGEGIELSGSVDVGEGSVELYYTGSGVNADAFNAYCAGMAAKGYTLVQENTVEDSIFRLYRNTSTKVLLYTSYSAFSHAFEQNVKTHAPCIRVVTGSTFDAGNDFSDDLLQPAYCEYEKLTDTRLVAVRLIYEGGTNTNYGGNLYVMQLEDGSFIVQDGGFVNADSVSRLYNVLSDLHKQATGSAPTTANPITIAAWYLSHGHGDHTGNFRILCRDYGKTIKVETMIANNPSDLESYNCLDPNLYVRDNLSVISNYAQGPMKYIKVHTGMKLYIRNVEIEVLYTHEDLYPHTFERFNNSSTVLRTHIHSTDGEGNVQGAPTSILWLGDLQTRGSVCMRAMYGDYLKSDMVQIAHHGGSGCEREFYELTEAQILLWACSAKDMRNLTGNSNAERGSYAYVSYHAFHMASVEYNVASDIYNTTMTITKDGPVMMVGGVNGLYNAGESKAVTIGTAAGPGVAIVKMK
ncbi:MAG: hypothetical protein E7644_05845 [Ruminococcaceae bacterium]|nr:hypothetical protein [Oscillospiraceae bacterium]